MVADESLKIETKREVSRKEHKMSKREVLRRMYERATESDKDYNGKRMAISYIARRIGYDTKKTRQFIRDLNRLGMIASYEDKKSVVFIG